MKCPAEGCEYESPSVKALRGHWGGKQDEKHEGGWYLAVEELIEGSAVEPSEDEESEAQARARASDGGLEGDSEEGSEGSETDPTMGAADPSAASRTDDEDSDEVTLPCDHESFDPSEAPTPPFVVGCETCGQEWRVEDL